MSKKLDLPKKGEVWMRWKTLVTILDVIDSGLVGVKLIQYMTPDGRFGSIDSKTWQNNILDGSSYVVACNVEQDEV